MKTKMNEKFIEQLNKLLSKTRTEWDSELPLWLSDNDINKLNTNGDLIIRTKHGMLNISVNGNTLNFMEYFYFPSEALQYTQDDIDEMD